MKFNVGDNVCCKNSTLKGTITRLLDSRHVVILDTETGMEVDYPIHTLILVEASHKELTAKNPTQKDTVAPTLSKNITIDLHTEKLPRNYRTHPPLKGQLDYFEYKMALAIQQGVRTVTVVHGKGNGILKNEVTKRLRGLPQVKNFTDPEKLLALKDSKLVVLLK
jgi:dsDNA-specific endonuclease/ATPase MutS2